MKKTHRTNCYNCGSWEYEYYDSENGFNLVKCKTCGLLYVNPRPTDEEIALAHKTGLYGGDKIIDTTGCFEKQKIKRYLGILTDFYDRRVNANFS